MKVKPHIRGGIGEKNGTFKSGCRQVGINGKPIRHLSDLYVAAGEASPAFQSVMDSLRNSVPDLKSRDVEVCEMKHHSRAARKAQEEFAFRKPGPAEAWLSMKRSRLAARPSLPGCTSTEKEGTCALALRDCGNRSLP